MALDAHISSRHVRPSLVNSDSSSFSSLIFDFPEMTVALRTESSLDVLFSICAFSVASDMPSWILKRTTSSCALAATANNDSAAVNTKCFILIIVGYFS